MGLKEESTINVLVLDAKQRSALAVTRSLGEIDNVVIFTADSSQDALAGHSKFSNKYLECPSAAENTKGFIDWLSVVITRYSIKLLLPVTEVTSQSILLHKDILPSVGMSFASYDQVMKLANKSDLVKMSMRLGVPVPKTKHYANAAELEFSALTYPCVLKPALSHIFKKNGWVGTKVRILESEEDLSRALAEDDYLESHEFMVQEFIPGHGAGLFCFYNQGQGQAYFAHNRIREKPPWGGVSVLSESVPVDGVLKEYADKLLKEVNWHGVAMVEFRLSSDGQPYLMEINTRFWGSLQLAIDSGVDFPRRVYYAGTGQELTGEEIYRTKRRLRWLLGDLDSLYIYLKADRYSLKEKSMRFLQFMFGNPFNARHEVNRLYDVGPSLYEIKTYVKDLMS